MQKMVSHLTAVPCSATWARLLLVLTFVSLSGQIVWASEPNNTSEASTTENKPSGGELKVGKLRFNKVLILGNSITLHGPAPKIGWTGNWGMAASAKEKDYVHLLTNRMTKAVGGTPQVKIKNIADFERKLTDYNLSENLKQELEFNADLIIIALGENASRLKTNEDKERFRAAFTDLFAELKQRGQPTIFVRGQFWADADKDLLMRETSEAAKGIYIDISKLGSKPSNYARAERKFKHAGVAAHPGDKGMQEIAAAIWTAIETHAQAK